MFTFPCKSFTAGGVHGQVVTSFRCFGATAILPDATLPPAPTARARVAHLSSGRCLSHLPALIGGAATAATTTLEVAIQFRGEVAEDDSVGKPLCTVSHALQIEKTPQKIRHGK